MVESNLGRDCCPRVDTKPTGGFVQTNRFAFPRPSSAAADAADQEVLGDALGRQDRYGLIGIDGVR
jgi:hypothetical protein